MMYSLNKIAWMVLNPVAVGLLILVIALLVLNLKRCSRLGGALIFGGGLWLWIFSSPALTLLTGYTLEEDYPPIPAENLAAADAIVCLGGGVGRSTKFGPQTLLYAGADRAYYSAARWKAGRAPIVIPTGASGELSDAKFMIDLGVPREVIHVEDKAKNTEQNAKNVSEMLSGLNHRLPPTNHQPLRILLVTSAWHMKRSLLMFEKYAPELDVIPAPTDHECLYGDGCFKWEYLRPDAACIELNLRYFHEWVGYWWYKLVR